MEEERHVMVLDWMEVERSGVDLDCKRREAAVNLQWKRSGGRRFLDWMEEERTDGG